MIEQFMIDIPTAALSHCISSRTIERMFGRGLPCYRTSARGKRLIRPDELQAFLVKEQAPSTNLDALINEVASSFVNPSKSSKQRSRLTSSRRSV
jgi:hypothetical protein